jgi:hypothetical protein
MPCQVDTLPGGQRAIMCGGRSRAPRCVCGSGARAELLCDWKVDPDTGATCSRPICASCSTVPAPGKDLCPDHAKAWEAWKAAHLEHSRR